MEKKNLNKKEKFTPSIKSQIMLVAVFLVLFQSASLITTLKYTDFFIKLDQQVVDSFNKVANERLQVINKEIATIIYNTAETSKLISAEYAVEASKNNSDIDDVLKENTMSNDAYRQTNNHLLQLIRENNVTGAFFIGNTTGNDDHTIIHIKNKNPESIIISLENYTLFKGSDEIESTIGIKKHSLWTPTMNFDKEKLEQGDYDYFIKPIEAVNSYPNSDLERYGYWSGTTSDINENNNDVYYTLPVVIENNKVIGIIGIEIDSEYFTEDYIPNSELDYEDSFYAITKVNEQSISIYDNMPSSDIAYEVLKGSSEITTSNKSNDGLYESEIDDFGKIYIKISPVSMYSNDSPFYNETWQLSCVITERDLNQNSEELQSLFYKNFFGITCSSLIISFTAVMLMTKKITGLSSYVRSLMPYQTMKFKKTNIREIDDLINAVTMLNERVIDSSHTTDRILKMSDLDIGGYEINNADGGVIITEYIASLINKPGTKHLTKEQWKIYYKSFTERPAEEKENTYTYVFRDTRIWLTILESKTQQGVNIGVILDVTKEVLENIEVQRRINYDDLTQIYNRLAFYKKAEQLVKQAPNKVGVGIFIDLDNLKFTNDTYGHETGDLLIVSAAKLFKEFENYGGVVARNSGDEFIIYIHGFNTIDGAREVIKKEYSNFQNEHIELPNGEKQRIRFSMGVAWYPQNADNVQELIQLADFAMYEAKHKAKGTVKEFDPVTYNKNIHILENREAINKLLDEKLIYFMYQPIVDLKSGEVFAYEALMRSKISEFKSPKEILDVASAQSKLGKLEEVVILSVIEDISNRRSEFGDSKIFINSITNQSVSKEQYEELKIKYGNLLENIVLEITEAEDDTPEQMHEKVSAVKDCGMIIAIDDFGSGYSNEMRIVSIQPNIIKIDMELIQGIHKNPDKEKLVYNLVSFCHEKDIDVVAEGVEELEDLEKIMSIGVDYVQGYFMARPDSEVKDILEDKKEIIKNFIR